MDELNQFPDDNPVEGPNDEGGAAEAPIDHDSSEADAAASLLKAYLDAVPEIRESQQNMLKAIGSISFAPVVEMAKTWSFALSSAAQAIESTLVQVQPLIKSIAESLRPVYESLSRDYAGVDWDALRRGSRRWGECGWVISHLTPKEICESPFSLEHADGYYMELITDPFMERLFEEVGNSIYRKTDFEECVALYKERHYKACAMMTCSLIEATFIRLSRIKPKQSKSFGKNVDKVRGLPSKGYDALALENWIALFDYFFKNGNNFARENEGELNRHFLMHGRMYKRVKKTTCIKLLLFLEMTVTMLPDALGFAED